MHVVVTTPNTNHLKILHYYNKIAATRRYQVLNYEEKDANKQIMKLITLEKPLPSLVEFLLPRSIKIRIIK